MYDELNAMAELDNMRIAKTQMRLGQIAAEDVNAGREVWILSGDFDKNLRANIQLYGQWSCDLS